MNNPYNLKRFVDAQQSVYEEVCLELKEDQKRSNWMWFIFPQMKGLGHSDMAKRYAISSREEAEAYLSHPVLGQRLRECSRLVAAINGRSIEDIFGYPDFMKFRSSMTLFTQVDPDEKVFSECLQKYFGEVADPDTLAWLSSPKPAQEVRRQ